MVPLQPENHTDQKQTVGGSDFGNQTLDLLLHVVSSGLDLPFMMMPHPLLPMGLPPASVAMAMSQMNHLSTIANMAAAAQQIHTHVHRAPVIKVNSFRQTRTTSADLV